jgi:hypothetical protein
VGQLLHQEMIAGGMLKLVKGTAVNSMATICRRRCAWLGSCTDCVEVTPTAPAHKIWSAAEHRCNLVHARCPTHGQQQLLVCHTAHCTSCDHCSADQLRWSMETWLLPLQLCCKRAAKTPGTG